MGVTRCWICDSVDSGTYSVAHVGWVCCHDGLVARRPLQVRSPLVAETEFRFQAAVLLYFCPVLFDSCQHDAWSGWIPAMGSEHSIDAYVEVFSAICRRTCLHCHPSPWLVTLFSFSCLVHRRRPRDYQRRGNRDPCTGIGFWKCSCCHAGRLGSVCPDL